MGWWMIGEALCLARIESNWGVGGGKGVCISNERGRRKRKRKKIYPREQGKSILPAAYALFVFFFSFLLLSFVCERNKKVVIESRLSKRK